MTHPLQNLFDEAERRAAEPCPRCGRDNGVDWVKCAGCALTRKGWRCGLLAYEYRPAPHVRVSVSMASGSPVASVTREAPCSACGLFTRDYEAGWCQGDGPTDIEDPIVPADPFHVTS